MQTTPINFNNLKLILMAASAEMPYFINPSKPLDRAEKIAAYKEAYFAINANLTGETNTILKMSTINCLMKTYLPYFYWVGFYMVDNGRLIVGPYQGTLGCLSIDFSRGVCGKAAREEKTQVVQRTHDLEEGADHISCDPNSLSEIVVPVKNARGELIAVFDVDATEANCFDEVDKDWLERIIEEQFGNGSNSV